MAISAAHRALLDPKYAAVFDTPTTVDIVETEQDGAGTISFAVSAPSAVLLGKAGGSIYWLADQSCADGAIILECPDGLHVHVIELKRTLNAKSWDKAKRQFAGMLTNIRAFSGNCGLPAPVKVTCHLAFQYNNFGAAPVLAKVLNTPAGPVAQAAAQWASKKLDFLEWTDVDVIAVSRDGVGNGHATLGC